MNQKLVGFLLWNQTQLHWVSQPVLYLSAVQAVARVSIGDTMAHSTYSEVVVEATLCLFSSCFQ